MGFFLAFLTAEVKVDNEEAVLLSPTKTVRLPVSPAKSPLKPVKVLKTPQKIQPENIPVEVSEEEGERWEFFLYSSLCASFLSRLVELFLTFFIFSRKGCLDYGQASLLKPEVKECASYKLPKKYENLLKLFESAERASFCLRFGTFFVIWNTGNVSFLLGGYFFYNMHLFLDYIDVSR